VTRSVAWRAAVAATVGAVAIACSPAATAYFPEPNPTRVTGTAEVGRRAFVGVADLVAAGADRVVLVNATPVGLRGAASVEAWALRRADTGGGGVGFATDRDLQASIPFSALARPLPSFAFSGADGPVEVVLALESDRPGTVAFDAVALRFRVDGGATRTETFPASGTIEFRGPGP
jgi:hypothetical protein